MFGFFLNLLGLDNRTQEQKEKDKKAFERKIRIRNYNFMRWLREEFQRRYDKRMRDEKKRRKQEEHDKEIMEAWIASLAAWQKIFVALSIAIIEIMITGIKLLRTDSHSAPATQKSKVSTASGNGSKKQSIGGERLSKKPKISSQDAKGILPTRPIPTAKLSKEWLQEASIPRNPEMDELDLLPSGMTPAEAYPELHQSFPVDAKNPYMDKWGEQYSGSEWKTFKELYESLPAEAKEKADSVGSHPLDFVKHHEKTLRNVVRKYGSPTNKKQSPNMDKWKNRLSNNHDYNPN
jgi:hypothetical protein